MILTDGEIDFEKKFMNLQEYVIELIENKKKQMVV